MKVVLCHSAWELGTPPRVYIPSLVHLSPKTWDLSDVLVTTLGSKQLVYNSFLIQYNSFSPLY